MNALENIRGCTRERKIPPRETFYMYECISLIERRHLPCQIVSQRAMTSHRPTSQSTCIHAAIRRLRTGPLHLLVVLLLSDAVLRRSGALLFEFFTDRAMKLLFEDRLGLNGLELGLEVIHVMGGGIASTAGVGHVGPDIFDLVTGGAPKKMLSVTGSWK